jgi:para-nitrobenzyl esterase
MKKILIAVFLTAVFAQIAVSQIQTAKVTGGEVQGVVTDGISVFKGIPFAAPPVGDLRWKGPAPLSAWTGVKKADAFGPACMQAANSQGNTAAVSEDCLYLNVWTPAKKSSEKIPVIVWIYGGGFAGGSTSVSMYDGMGFAKKGVVLVSVAYRVGPFGFLAHSELSRESGKGSGTYGIQDMIAGLQWVKANVARFGGDPSNVTIFGHSAGGMAVNMLSASPVAKGLFHRAICMSGGSFAPLQTTNEGGIGLGIPTLKLGESTGEEFMKKLGAADIKAARAMSAEAIQKNIGGGMGGFRPVADGYVLPSDLYSIYQARRFNDTPILLGNTSDELGSFGGRGKTITVADYEKQIRSQYGAHADAILKVYPHSTDAEVAKSSKALSRDSTFAWSTWTWSRLQTQLGKGKAYQYYYDHHAPEADGSGHGSDVPYAFQTLAAGGRGGAPKPEDLKLSDIISSYWVNFAKTGNPNGPGLPKWPAFAENDQQAMVFDAVPPSAKPMPNLDKLKAYDGYISSRREEAKKDAGK